MVSKPEIQFSTMAVVEYLKRDSSFDDEYATKFKVNVHNSKKTRIIDNVSALTRRAKQSKTNRKRTVTFSSKSDVFEIARRTREEKKDMHMSPEDQRLIIRDISIVVSRFKRDEQLIEDLGLDRIVEQQDPKRMERVKSAIFAILQRQRQSKLFPSSKKSTQSLTEVWLEKYYRPSSKLSANLARSRGLQDQETTPFLCPRKIVMAR